MQVISSSRALQVPTAIALGNFDGVHRGHLRVIQPVLDAAAGIKTVVSFAPHPRAFFSGEHRLLLTPSEEKAAYLATLGIEQLVLLPFNQALASLSPEQFVAQVLHELLQVKFLSVGKNFRFGHRRAGTADCLKAIAEAHGIAVHITPLEVADQERISSSAVRQALSKGDLEKANHLLGRPYCLSGKVVHGQHLGRTLGFPTANLEVPAGKFVPPEGVYAAQAHLQGEAAVGQDRPKAIATVVNIGYRPTVQGRHRTIEAHLMGWSGDLYGQTLTLELHHYLRQEQSFEGLEALKAQIQRDCQQAQHRLLGNCSSYSQS